MGLHTNPAAFPGLTVCVKYYIIRLPGSGSPNAATTLKSKSRNIAYYVTSIQSPAREVWIHYPYHTLRSASLSWLLLSSIRWGFAHRVFSVSGHLSSNTPSAVHCLISHHLTMSQRPWALTMTSDNALLLVNYPILNMWIDPDLNLAFTIENARPSH